MSFVEAAIAKCRCPVCGAKDLHDGARARAHGSITEYQNINIACFVCFARFNILMVGDRVLRAETCDPLDEDSLNSFRPAHFENILTMARLDSFVRT